MFRENEGSIMTAPGFGSNGSSCQHMFGPTARTKMPGSHLKHLHWLYIQLLIVILAGQAAGNNTTSASSSPEISNAQNIVHYFLDVNVDVIGQEQDESDIIAWPYYYDCNVKKPYNYYYCCNNVRKPYNYYYCFNVKKPYIYYYCFNVRKPYNYYYCFNNVKKPYIYYYCFNVRKPYNNYYCCNVKKPYNYYYCFNNIKKPYNYYYCCNVKKPYNYYYCCNNVKKPYNYYYCSFLPNSDVTTVAPDEENEKTPNPNSNNNPSNRLRVAREANDKGTQARNGETSGIFQKLTVSCSKKTAIKSTNCSVMLSLTQRVSPCCVLRTLCEASKSSPDIKAVGRKVDIINPIQNECSSNPKEDNSCIYTGGESGSCLGGCRLILNFTKEVPICSVSAIVSFVLQSENQISITRPVTRAAICGNPEVSLQESELTWVVVDFEPAPFCTAVEQSSGIKCKNGESLLVLLKQQCDQPFTTAGPNVTTTTPNTTLSVNTTESPMNTTTNVTVTTTLATTATTLNVLATALPLSLLTTAEGQANALLETTKDVSNLNASQVNQLVSELERLLSGPNVSLALGTIAIQIVSNLLGASPEVVSESSNRIIGIVDTVGLRLVLDGQDQTILASDLALGVTPADGENFQETSFSISDPDNVQLSGGSRLRRSVRTDSSIPQGSVRLPASLTQNLSSEEQQLASRVQFNFYQRSTVFQDRSLGSRRLNSGILGASVANLSISGLQESIIINLRNIEPVPANFVATCVFWDFTLNDESGGWNQDGCSVQQSDDNETVCACSHLTNFAILLDLSRTPLTSRLQATILTFITYIGCGVSAIFLAVTLLTYLAFGKLRKDIPSKILIQLCFALLLLNLVFLVDAWLALYPDAVGLCISTAWFLHYFLLVAFTWMGLEAVHMYLALVKVFNSYISRYMLKFSLVGWGVPMIMVIIVIAIDKDNYGLVSYGRFTDGTSDDFCWLKNDIAFYVAVVAYFCVIFLFNLVMFVVVLVQLCRIKRQNPHNSSHRTTLQDVRSVAGITILLGLTWGFAFFAWGPVNLAFMYLFAIFNSLQGFFIFVFHCAVKENVRRQWRTYLCCGRMRLAENSEWSRTATQKTMKKSSGITSDHSSQFSQSNSSSSFLVTDSSDQVNGISSPYEDRSITADEEPNSDVVLNEINRQYRNQQGL
ncbi:adhesion G-protein coupled receptor G2 [Cheilinus undulatus]|uniref:adhesion G-protein coupled receptor G2 n=1 Tax=Cheilinus undulatus TaxID=241271 RepID=UPI001BD31459|nr:adhesion G-protein coupled receptor G2 [Cheilinus undulatus]